MWFVLCFAWSGVVVFHIIYGFHGVFAGYMWWVKGLFIGYVYPKEYAKAALCTWAVKSIVYPPI